MGVFSKEWQVKFECNFVMWSVGKWLKNGEQLLPIQDHVNDFEIYQDWEVMIKTRYGSISPFLLFWKNEVLQV